MADLKREEEIEIIVKNLSGLTALRRFANTQSFDWLEDVFNKLSTIISEKREEEELFRLELSEQEEKRLKALKYLEELGLDPETINISIFDAEPKRKKKRKVNTAPAKYRFTDPDTEKVDTWTGIGRPKKGLQKLLDKGHDLEEFLIKESHNVIDELKEAENVFKNHPPALG